jgi:tetratricopeptide (TPR) repeat protein
MLSQLSLQPKYAAFKHAWLWYALLLLPLVSVARDKTCFSSVTVAEISIEKEIKEIPGSQGSSAGSACMPSAASLENARMLLLTENISSAVVEYARLVAVDSVNVSLNSEYAYALALCGVYDAALIRLDRVWGRKLNQADAGYLASQVFQLMGYKQLAGEFWKEMENNKAPAWISTKAPSLLQKYQRKTSATATGNRDELIADFKRANRLAAQNSLLRSIALFEEITTRFPQEYLPYVGYSIALERAGMLLKSAQVLETALSLTGNSPEEVETKQFLTKRLTSVRAKINTTNPQSAQAAAPAKAVEKTGKPMMAYAGGMIQPEYINFNLRYGYFLSQSGNLSMNLGWTGNSEGLYTSLGLLYYQRHKVFVAGFGLSGNFGNGTSVFYLKMSPGLSFMNKKKSASWDIFWDVQFPFQNKYATTVGFSIGRSFYFGNR